MEILEKKILEKGKVLPGNVLKVDSFLNVQIDVGLQQEMGKDIAEHFKGKGVNKILTIEASGIAMAVITAQYFGNVNVVFAKKSKTLNISNDLYTSKCYSFTHQTENDVFVSKNFLSEKDNVLIIDDFLANGEATRALIDIVNQAKAKLVGVAIGVEKGFQGGGDKMRDKGIDVYSLAVIDRMENGKITFRK